VFAGQGLEFPRSRHISATLSPRPLLLSSGQPKPAKPNRWAKWISIVPFVFMHVACLAIFLPGIHLTWTAAILFAVFYAMRVFGLTAGYHRYFAHRAYKTSRAFQFVLALMGGAALQRGALWWAGHHRHHHRFSDTEEDVHSPIKESLWQSHVGWIFDERWDHTPFEQIHDFAKYPELRFLEKHHWIPGLAVAVCCFLVGGWSGLVYGFFLGTVAVYHVTFMVNSVCHLLGKRKYPTGDFSKNNLFVALATFGEGWHNNHHHYQSSANQGFFWWEIDISYLVLRALSWVGIVWELRLPPKAKTERPAVVPPPHLVEPALSRVRDLKTERQTALPPIAALNAAVNAPAEAALFTSPMFAAAQAMAAPMMERVSAAALVAQERMSAAAGSMRAAAHAAGESVSAAAHVLEERVSAAAHSASESMKMAAQAASDAMAAAAATATPVVVTAAVAAAPMVVVVSQVTPT
jgi:stearoyl-CoA desaturase (delta-9 desaturase)